MLVEELGKVERDYGRLGGKRKAGRYWGRSRMLVEGHRKAVGDCRRLGGIVKVGRDCGSLGDWRSPKMFVEGLGKTGRDWRRPRIRPPHPP